MAALTLLMGGVAGIRRALDAGLPRAERAAYGAFATILILNLLHNQTEATLFMRGTPFWNIAVLALFMVSRPRSSWRSDGAEARR